MKNFETHDFDDPRNWIRTRRQKGKSWEEIQLACKDNEEQLEDFLNDQVENNYWPEMEVADWVTLVALEEDAETETISIATSNGEATLLDDTEDNAVTIPTDRNSAWQIYKKTLQEKSFKPKSIEIMERATLKILKRLNDDTTNSKPIKGLVIGNVQSGKTANMAALMAMAADWGWNMFIILSGTIDNLRKQTQSRLFGDLNQQRCRLVWRSLTHLKRKMAPGDRAQDLDFSSNSMQRYFTVCLKNSTRLKDLIQWLQYSPSSQGQMKILVIDDEADQAGINTASISEAERTRINKLLCSLVNGKNEKNQDIDSHYQAMNYIGYTATPYANVLNEAGEESLYPRNFITTLSVSKEYFGPQQIFGSENTDYEGLDIVRTIKDDEIEAIKSIHNGDTNTLFESLISSICWFICGVACMRLWGYKKPISMLVHTSQRTVHHDFISRAIQNWLLSNTEADIIECCKRVWTNECETFSFEKFKEQYKDYDCADEEINKYPNFDDLLNNIRQILRGDRVSNIKLGEDKTLTYHDGIHLCVDNCRNNGTDGEWYVRLAYPDKEHMPSPAPAFIVVGGATLSRGLTLEGLISTFFLRTVNQADTLMQMGRWFGYRKGYELIPRLWLTGKTIDQFKFLSDLDQELREEIHVMEIMGKSPSKYGPRIKNTPKINFIRITANNRMQSAQPTDLDYSGTFRQTHLFYENEDILRDNLDKTKQFIINLGSPDGNPNSSIKEEKRTFRNAIVWRNIPFDRIKGFLSEYRFHERQNVLNDMETLLSWIVKITENGKLKNWNVVLAGTENRNSGELFDLGNGYNISKINRARKIAERPESRTINIGALRNTKDLLADIDPNIVSDEIADKITNPRMKDTKKIRIEAGYGDIPLLLLYIVDKDSKAANGSETREDLNAPFDLAGVCINIPFNGTDRTNTVATISIHFPEEDLFNDNGDIEDANED